MIRSRCVGSDGFMLCLMTDTVFLDKYVCISGLEKGCYKLAERALLANTTHQPVAEESY